ncbi:MAG: LON peptidase substrate-binding domain-containing protein [Pseudomonadota bacterium]
MIRTPFDPTYEQLPEVLPIFPLQGALLLPGGQLPLNIFEPRYLNMVQDALAGPRLIGMIQPSAPDEDQGSAAVYRVGCAGRITAFSETGDGRYLITLSGLIRFQIGEELPLHQGYRRVQTDYRRFRADMEDDEGPIDRTALLEALKRYFEANDLQSDWKAIENADNARLVTSLAMVCPFEPSEKQAILEAESLSERAETMIAILRLSRSDQEGQGAPH